VKKNSFKIYHYKPYNKAESILGNITIAKKDGKDKGGKVENV